MTTGEPSVQVQATTPFGLGLHHVQLSAPPGSEDAAREFWVRKAHPGILVRDLDALATRMAAHGIEITWDGSFPGMRRFYAADPHGNRLEFLSPS